MTELHCLQVSGKAVVVTWFTKSGRCLFLTTMAQTCKQCSSVISPPIYMKKNALESHK